MLIASYDALAPTPDHRVPPGRLDGDWTQNGEAWAALAGVAIVVFRVDLGWAIEVDADDAPVNFEDWPMSSATGDP